MQLTVMGATGRSGLEVVREALERGHHVTALARTQAKRELLPADDRLTVVLGDLLDESVVMKAVDGADAVLNVAGPGKGSPRELQQRAVANLLAAMRDRGVDRLVTLTGAGVRAEGDRPKLIDQLFHTALKTLQPALLADSEAAIAAVRSSHLRWTVVRAPRLTQDAPQGRYRVSPTVGRDTGTKLARGDLARFVLDEVENDGYVGALPVVSA